MDYTPQVNEAWMRFRQGVDGLDLLLRDLEARADANDACMPFEELLDAQRLVTATVVENGPFLASRRERDPHSKREADARDHLRMMEEAMLRDPEDCVPHDIAVSQVVIWRDTFERWGGTNTDVSEHWTPDEINPRFV